MSLDKVLLSTLSNRSRYKALIDAVPMDQMGTQTAWLLKSYGTFFDKHKGIQDVDFDMLRTMVRLKVEGEAATPVLALIDAAKSLRCTDGQIKAVVEQLYEMKLAGTAARLVNE